MAKKTNTKNERKKTGPKKGAKNNAKRTGGTANRIKTNKGIAKPKTKKRVSKPIQKTRSKQFSKNVRNTSKGNATKKYSLNISTPRNKNILVISNGGKPENISKKFAQNFPEKNIKYFLNKNKPIRNKPSKEPKAVVLIMTVKNDEGVTKTFSELSPDTMVVNSQNVKKFITDKLADSGNEFTDLYNSEIETIKSFALKFIY